MEDEFHARLNQRLAKAVLTGNAERTVGAQIVDELAREIKGAAMHRALTAHGIELKKTVKPMYGLLS
ncbi:hypothetical protein [Bradyrhizobium vignae]|uniref:Uncharacterized protein n=1 Tax=Bradyrhizobium vignae TaxID=1549949 RepID=A0ABS3ZTY2_9BRAD|nr:hypothetical protein [Bradyrhizobium vignae]MBP0111612.1 hypothetical protein [Bradyrhizobium vignae]